MKTWSSRISELRGLGMKLKEIGAEIGLSPSSVCDLEQGRSKSPTGEAALKLDELHALRCSRSQSGTRKSVGR
jgi:transcriptional regulator with XRE-family HTH domain